MSVHNVLLNRKQAEYIVSLLEWNDTRQWVPDHDDVAPGLAAELRVLWGMVEKTASG